jgi:hypothetical protein
MITHDVNEIGIGQDIGNGGKGRELTQRVASEGSIRLDKAFRAHILEGSTGHYNKGDMCKLSGKKKTFWMSEGVLKGADIDIHEEWGTLDVAVLICCGTGNGNNLSVEDGPVM